MQIEGIPWLFVEKIPKRATATAEPSNAANYTAAYGGGTVAGLVVDGEKAGQEIDRKKGIGRSRNLSFSLAYSPLEGSGIVDDLFQKPSLLSDVAADIDSAATSFTATAVGGGWSAGGVYIGSEYIWAAGVSHSEPTTTFSSLTRGHWGDKYDHKAQDLSVSRLATDRPNLWRGRMVTLWECAVNPEGRSLFDQWLAGDYCRQVFKGTLDASPAPGSYGFRFTASSLIRKLTKKMGFSGVWHVRHSGVPKDSSVTEQDAIDGVFYTAPALYVPAHFYNLDFHIKLSDSTDLSIKAKNATSLIYNTLGDWASAVSSNLISQSSSKLTNPSSYQTSKAAYFLFNVADAGSGVTLSSESKVSITGNDSPYFLQPNQQAYAKKTANSANISNQFKLLARWDWSDQACKPWLVLQNFQAKTLQDYALPSSGYAIAELAGNKELIKFEQTTAVDDFHVVFISGRGLNNTTPVNLADPGVQIKLATGEHGSLHDVSLKLLESSGTGERGTYDTLGQGMGYGIDDGHIDETSFDTGSSGDPVEGVSFGDRVLTAIDDTNSSFEGALGGWFTLAGNCVVERRNSSGVLQLCAVKHQVYQVKARDPSVVTITASDILLKGVEPVEVVESPNEVMVDSKSFSNGEAPDMLVRSVPEMVREGVRSWNIKAPGMHLEDAYNAGSDLIALGAGQFAIKLTLGPWVDLQVGDMCILEMNSHRATFDFDAGTVGTTSTSARCVGMERDLVTLEQKATFLIYGHTLPASVYCPTTTVTAHSGSTVTVTAGQAAWFAATETIRLFNPGREELGTPEIADITINSISGNVITMGSAAPAWVANGTTRATYPRYSIASATQRGFFFFSALYRWN